MMVRVFLGADPPYGVIQGVCRGRTLSILARATTAWFACGWYDRVIVDLSSFHDWSPEAADLLARAVTTADDAGYWLGFFPPGPHAAMRTGHGVIHGYPDLAHALAALRDTDLRARDRIRGPGQVSGPAPRPCRVPRSG
jgi:hypothetical protein